MEQAIKIMKKIKDVISVAILTVLLPITTLNTWLFALISGAVLFVGFCVNKPLLYLVKALTRGIDGSR